MSDEHSKTFELMTQWRERALNAEEKNKKILAVLQQCLTLVCSCNEPDCPRRKIINEV